MTRSENQTTSDRGAGIEILSTPAQLDPPPAMAWSIRAADPIRRISGLAGCFRQELIPGATNVRAINEVIIMEHRPGSVAREVEIAARREGSDWCRPG